MNIATARTVAQALYAAAAKAEAAGQTDIPEGAALTSLRELDDAARAELSAAIEAAEAQRQG